MTYASDTAIANSALVIIGEDRITSLSSDTSRRAVYANQQYPIKRDELLCKYRWGFATKRVALAQLADTPTFGFAYAYALPSDFLKFIGVYDAQQSKANYTATEIIHKIESVDDQRVLVTDETEVNAVYTYRVTNTLNYDPHFGEALACLLAKNLAGLLTSGPEAYNKAAKLYKDAIREAKEHHAFESTPEVIESSAWVDSRFGGDLRNMGWARG